MSLLTQKQTEPTKAEKQARVAERILQSARQIYQQLVSSQQQGIQMLWQNGQGLTPQEVCDGLGADAAKVFELHGMMTNAIVQIATAGGIQPDITFPTNAFTINADGSVTVLETPYIIPKSL